MAGNYTVWVSEAGDTKRVALLETDTSSDATALLEAIVKPSGSTTFDAGITILKGEPPPPPPPPQGGTKESEKAPEPPKPPEARAVHAQRPRGGTV